jgi:hypothetical protein
MTVLFRAPAYVLAAPLDSHPRALAADGRFTRLEGDPCTDFTGGACRELAATTDVVRSRRAAALMHPGTARRRQLPYVALVFLGLDMPLAAQPSELRPLHAWLDTWHGIGLIDDGLERQERNLSLTFYEDRWGAAVFVTGGEHATTQGFRGGK